MTKRFEFDPAHTRFAFTAKHMMVSTVHGHFGQFGGYVELAGDQPTTARGEATIQVGSVSTNDERRDGHLRSGDFFDVEKYPEMTFKTTGVKSVGKDKYQVVGDLTIKDVTKPVTLDVKLEGRFNDPWGNDRVGITAQGTIDRRDWGLTWNQVMEAGRLLVSDKIHLQIEAELTAAAEAQAA